MYVQLSSRLSSPDHASWRLPIVMLTSGGWGISPDEMPKTLPQFIELMDALYRKSLNGAAEQHILDSLQVISDALEEDQFEVHFDPIRMGESFALQSCCLYPDLLLTSDLSLG